MIQLKRSVTVALSAAVLCTLAACGSTAPSQDEADAQDRAERTGGPVSLTDADGEALELPAPALDIATLEWQQTEMAITLGVQPVAVADIEGYKTWDSAEELSADAVDVGTRSQVSPGTLLGAFETEPDLVIVEQGDPIIEKMRKNYPDVPLLATRGADAEDPIGNMKETFTLIAAALGREAEGEEILAEFDQTLADAKAEVEAADPEVTDFVYADAYIVGSTLSVRPFGQGSLMGELGEELGLANAWKGEVDEVYGLGGTDLEGLTDIEDAYLFYTSTESEPWLGELEKNPLYKNSDFVEDDLTRPFPSGIWTFGGPASAEQVIDAYVSAVG